MQKHSQHFKNEKPMFSMQNTISMGNFVPKEQIHYQRFLTQSRIQTVFLLIPKELHYQRGNIQSIALYAIYKSTPFDTPSPMR